MSDSPILFAYDGSDYAKAAIEQAAVNLESGRHAIVLTVWQPFSGAFVAGGMAPAGLEQSIENDARRVADEGARLAREAGFDAHAAVERGDSVWHHIVDAADDRDVGIVVMGSAASNGVSRAL